MKRLILLLICLLSISLFTFSAYAEHDVNLMSAYDKIPWEGDTLYYEAAYGTLSFRGESGKACVTFPTDNAHGIWFYLDMGNKLNKGTGYAELEFLSNDNKTVDIYTIEKSNGSGYYNRYELGNKEEYLLIPENTANVRVTLYYTGGEQSPYFRNFALILSNDIIVNADLEWDISGNLQIVQVGVTKSQHIIWIVIVFVVAGTFVLIRKRTDKLKKIK